MDITREQPIRRYKAGKAEALNDTIITETRIELDINDGEHRMAMLCLARDLEALAVGFLWSEGVLRSRADLHEVKMQLDTGRVFVRGDFDADAMEGLANRWTWGTGCGSGGTSRDLDKPIYSPAAPGPTISPDQLLTLSKSFDKKAELWQQTGGVHACALGGADGLILFAEDVGRHNAFDKIVGQSLLDNIPLADKFMLTTGRLSAEIVSKAVACKIPILASRSSVTALAVDLAKRFNITLVGFARASRLNVYTGFDRIVQ